MQKVYITLCVTPANGVASVSQPEWMCPCIHNSRVQSLVRYSNAFQLNIDSDTYPIEMQHHSEVVPELCIPAVPS